MLISLYAYNAEHLLVENFKDIAQLEALLKQWPCVWIRVRSGEVSPEIASILNLLQIKTASQENLFDDTHPTHLTFFSSGLLKVSHVSYFDQNYLKQKMDIFLGKNFILTLGKNENSWVEGVVLQLGNKELPIRSEGIDFLFFHIIDAFTETYLAKVRHIGQMVAAIESILVLNPEKFSINDFFTMRGNLAELRRDLWSQRDVFLKMINFNRSKFFLIDDHVTSCFEYSTARMSDILDLLGTYIDQYESLLDIYFSSLSNQMNNIMKTLTIFSVIFLPLSFLAGLWGMNFSYTDSHWNMPELHWEYGYPFALGFMLLIVIILLTTFIKIGWLKTSIRKR
ncbi:hypothetical protein FJ364_06045 [Candidatus Dependentiae bacterium]|nr:hypothetical protein [Candidatus Dependentiae bacterium]